MDSHKRHHERDFSIDIQNDDDDRSPRFDPADPAEVANRLHEIGKLRRLYIDTKLFSNPGWDIALTLFIAGHDRRSIALSALATSNNLAEDQALEQLEILKDRGIIDWDGSAQTPIALSANGRQRMEAFLRSVGRR